MKLGTITAALVFALALAGLIASMRGVSAVPDQGPRVYTLAVWGSAQETNELRTHVIEPLNRRLNGARVRVIPIPSDYPIKLSTMIAGGIAPDFFYLSQEQVPAFAAQGALLDLTSFIERDDDPVTDLDDYYPSVVESFRWEDRLYGLPWIAQPVILYCNVDLFREAGVPLPDATWDWETFVEAGQRLTRDMDGDGRIDQWGFVLNGWPPVQIWIWQNDASLFDADTGELRLGDPAVLEAVDFYAGLIHQARIAPPLSLVSERGFSDLFKAGKVAMFAGGAADDLDRLPDLEVVAAEMPRGPNGTAPRNSQPATGATAPGSSLPASDEAQRVSQDPDTGGQATSGTRVTFAWTAGLHISAGVRDPDAAFEVWKQILDGIQHWKVPAPRRTLAAQLEQIEPRKAPSAEVIRAAMTYMRTPYISPHHAQWDRLYRIEFEEPILRTGVPAAEQWQRVGDRLRRVHAEARD